MKKTRFLLLFALWAMTFTISSCTIEEDELFFEETRATGNEADDPALPEDD
jgi:hypothetical protein